MTPSKISKKVISDKVDWVNKMLRQVETLPMDSFDIFISDKRNVFTAESCLRRALEALMDLGRHILAKGFGRGVSEYKEIGRNLGELGILSASAEHKFKQLAGYRNRMVHFYHEITDDEMYQICSSEIDDIRELVDDLLEWLKNHPDLLDDTL